MKITNKQWDDIRKYICENTDEIWLTAVSHTDSMHDAIVWLDGVSTGEYRLRVEKSTGAEHPGNDSDSMIVYRLSRNWRDDISDDEMCIEWVDGRPKRTKDNLKWSRDDEENFLTDEEYEDARIAAGFWNFYRHVHSFDFWKDFVAENDIA